MASLYRKWRSHSFDDLLGQEHVVRTLRNAVHQGRVAHAYLFTGPRGTGKTSTARILAKAVNCLQPSAGNPCNECEMCRAADNGRALDVIEIDAASNTSVDNVRELRERVAYAAGESRYKVYIVDEVHRLSGAAFDAFLKTLEEPPPHVIFVFASTEPHKVPATITSRCQRFDFHRIPAHVAFERLNYVAEHEGLRVSEGALRLIAQQGNGSLRDALGLLDQVAAYTDGQIVESDVRNTLGLADPGLVGRLTDYLLGGDLGQGLGAFQGFVEAGGDPRQLTKQFVEYWRALLLQVAGAPIPAGLIDPALGADLPQHAARLDEERVVAVLRAMTDQEFSSKVNVPLQLPFEIGYVQSVLAISELAPPARTVEPVAHASRPTMSLREIVTPSSEGVEPEPQQSVAPLPAMAPAPAGEIEAAWPRVVAAMRGRSQTLQALLRDAHVMKVEDGEITVGVLYDFHRNQLVHPQKRKIVEEVAASVLGTSYRVNCVRVTKEEVEAVRGRGALEQDDGFVAEVTEKLREFHARQLRPDNT